MDFKRPERCQPQRTGREDRRSKFYEISDNLGQQVQSVSDIQVAIRKHAIGEELQLLVQRGSEAPREIRVQHVSDYPDG